MKKGFFRLLFKHAECSPASDSPMELSIELDTNLNLLAHAQCEEAFLGSQCGGHGKCGADRILILEGARFLNTPTEAEKRLISADDLKRGVRLGCQAFPDHTDSDIRAQALARNASPGPNSASSS